MLPNNQDNQYLNRQYIINLMEQARDFEEGVRESAVQELDAIDSQKLKDILSTILDDPNEDVTARADAARTLARFYQSYGVNAIVQHLNDADRVLRWSLCRALGKYANIGDRQAIDAVVQVLLADADGDVRLEAAIVLGMIGDTHALPALYHAQQLDLGTGREGHQVASFATDAIRNILSREAGASTNGEV